MAGIEISALPAVVTGLGSDFFPVVQGGVTKRETADQLISKNNSIIGMATTSSASVGVLQQNGTRFIHSFGTNNLFYGSGSGNFTLSGSRNLGFGVNSLDDLTSGSDNLCFGSSSGTTITTGNRNHIFSSLPGNIITGSFNTLLGYTVGLNYTGAESNNILINNAGVNGESNIMRLGTTGSGAGQVDTSYIAGTTVNINTINIPTTASSSVGVIKQNSVAVMHSFGAATNFFVGANSGNFTNSGANFNTAVGSGGVLFLLSSGDNNTGCGYQSLQTVSSGGGNTAVGSAALGVTTGSNNIALGFFAGGSYTTSESNNICIGNNGTVTESNVIRIGDQGTGAGQQNKCYLAGDLTTFSGRVIEVTSVTGATYTTLITDHVLACNRSGAIAITLIASPVTGRLYKIKDISGLASSNNITITPTAGNIDGAASYVINTNYGEVDVIYTGSEWSVF